MGVSSRKEVELWPEMDSRLGRESSVPLLFYAGINVCNKKSIFFCNSIVRLCLSDIHMYPRGLLATDLIILNHGQVTRMTPELAPSSPNFHTTPMGGRLRLDIFNTQWPPLHGGSSAVQGLNS
ncbi:hypothetical protein TNCV_2187751 [Trichonephila clavipes]|nr:hypothetical protein TNCV_2187751 [Trichonephila clavipes]